MAVSSIMMKRLFYFYVLRNINCKRCVRFSPVLFSQLAHRMPIFAPKMETGIKYVSAIEHMHTQGVEVMELKEIKRMQVLRWCTCSEKLPLHHQEVIISAGGQCELSIFDAEEKAFYLKYNSHKKFYIHNKDIKWIAA